MEVWMETMQSYNLHIPRSDAAFFEKLVHKMGWKLNVVHLQERDDIMERRRKAVERIEAIAGSLPYISDDDLKRNKEEYLRKKYL